MAYVYIQSEHVGEGGATNNLYTVGSYGPNGDHWEPESDHASREEAAARTAWLNGSRETPPARPDPLGRIPRQPTEDEVREVLKEMVDEWGWDEADARWTLGLSVRFAVWDRYISDGPGYAGKVMVMLYSGGPECIEVVTWRDGKASIRSLGG